MTDIKELALKTLDAMAMEDFQVHNITYESGNTGVELDEPALAEYNKRLIAAYLAEQEPVGWMRAGRFFYADDPMYKNNHKGMRKVIAAGEVKP